MIDILDQQIHGIKERRKRECFESWTAYQTIMTRYKGMLARLEKARRVAEDAILVGAAELPHNYHVENTYFVEIDGVRFVAGKKAEHLTGQTISATVQAVPVGITKGR